MTPRPWVLIAVAGVALGVAFMAGRATAPRPTVELHQELDRAAASNSNTATNLHLGARDIDITLPAADVGGWAAPWDRLQPSATQAANPARARPGPAPAAGAPSPEPVPVPMAHIHIHEGSASQETQFSTQSSISERQRTDLTVTPAGAPWRALGFRFDDPFGERKLRLEAGLRVFGSPVWVRPGWKPADGLVKGWSLGADVQW